MKEKNNIALGTSIGLCAESTGVILFIVFLILKLTGTIDWNWFFIILPLWAPLVIDLIGFILYVLIIFFIVLSEDHPDS